MLGVRILPVQLLSYAYSEVRGGTSLNLGTRLTGRRTLVLFPYEKNTDAHHLSVRRNIC